MTLARASRNVVQRNTLAKLSMTMLSWTNMPRATPWIATLLAAVMLVAPSAEAQRKKAAPRKKPAATAKPKPHAAPPAPKPAGTPKAAEPPVESDTSATAPAMPPTSKPEQAEEKPPPAEEEPHDIDKDAKSKGKEPSLPPLLDIEAGFRFLQRHLIYKGDVNNVLPDYNLSGAPALALNVGVYPIRTGGFAVGVVGGFETAFAIGTTYEDPRPGQEGKRSASESAFFIGARGNYYFGKSFLGVGVDYGVQGYKVDLPPPTPDNAQVPNTSYPFIRPNVAARIGVASGFAVLANVGYLLVQSGGDLVSDARFVAARSSISGFDLGAGVGWAPFGGSLQNLEIRPMVAWRRFAFTFKPETTDPYQATGANDDYVAFSLLMGLRL